MTRLLDALLLYLLVRLTWRAAWRLSAPARRWRILRVDGFVYVAPRVSARYQLRELARQYLRARNVFQLRPSRRPPTLSVVPHSTRRPAA